MLTHFFRTTATLALFSVSLSAAKLPDDVMAVVKFPPPKTFTEKVMSVARAIQPGQQTEMMPLFFLGAFGYPNYPGISQTDNVSVFLFDSEVPSEMPFVVLAKVSKDSTLRQTAASFQWAMEDKGGWLLLSKDPSYLKLIKDIAPYEAVNAEPADFDVEFRVFLGQEKVKTWAANLKEMLEGRHAEASGGKHEAIDLYKKTRFVDFLAMAGENLNWAELGVDLSAETITIGSLVDARAGTAEATFFSAKAGGPVPVAEYITSQGFMSYTSNFDIKASSAYYTVLETRAMGLVGEKGKAWLTEAGKIIQSYFADSDGTSAGSVAMQGSDSRVVSASGGTYTDKLVVDSTKVFADKLLPELFTSLPYFKRHGMDYTFAFQENVAEVDGTPIHEFTTTFTMTPSAGEEEESLAKTLSEPFTQSQTNYYAVVDGTFLSASMLDDMKTLIPAVKAGVPVDGNVSDLTLASGEAMAYEVDLTAYFGIGLANLPDDAPAAAQMKQVYDEIKAAKLAPATGKVTTGKNRLKGTFSLPVTSLAKIVQGFQKLQPADPTYQMNGGGAPASDQGGM